MVRVVALAVLGMLGCGRIDFGEQQSPGDAEPGGDVGPDGAPPSGATDCFAHWLDHSVSISASMVQEVTELSSAGDDRDPWILDDGLRLYFSRDQGTPNTSDIFFASRGSTTQMFGLPAAIVSLNTSGREGRVSLTPDELTLVISTERGGSLDIGMTTRGEVNQPLASPDLTHLTSVNGVGTERDDPFLTADGLRLYLSSNSGPAGRFQLLVSTRSSASNDFGAPSVVRGFEADARNMMDPMLSRDERLLIFSILQASGNADLWYATRASPMDDFGTPVLVPGVDTTGAEVDPVLTADGCELYFASTRRDGKFHIFHAQVAK